MKALNTLVAILKGKAIILIKRDERKADVSVGKNLSRQFTINSMVGALKAMM